jgi:hypothetical protein
MKNESDCGKIQGEKLGKTVSGQIRFSLVSSANIIEPLMEANKEKETLFCNFSTYNGAISKQFIFESCNTNDEGNGLNESYFSHRAFSVTLMFSFFAGMMKHLLEFIQFPWFISLETFILLSVTERQKNNESFKNTSISTVTSTH